MRYAVASRHPARAACRHSPRHRHGRPGSSHRRDSPRRSLPGPVARRHRRRADARRISAASSCPANKSSSPVSRTTSTATISNPHASPGSFSGGTISPAATISAASRGSPCLRRTPCAAASGGGSGSLTLSLAMVILLALSGIHGNPSPRVRREAVASRGFAWHGFLRDGRRCRFGAFVPRHAHERSVCARMSMHEWIFAETGASRTLDRRCVHTRQMSCLTNRLTPTR